MCTEGESLLVLLKLQLALTNLKDPWTPWEFLALLSFLETQEKIFNVCEQERQKWWGKQKEQIKSKSSHSVASWWLGQQWKRMPWNQSWLLGRQKRGYFVGFVPKTRQIQGQIWILGEILSWLSLCSGWPSVKVGNSRQYLGKEYGGASKKKRSMTVKQWHFCLGV